MKTKFSFLIALIVCSAAVKLSGGLSPFGIVYGPKAAFRIAAPEGWVIDNSSGVDQGQPCVLYLKGATWENAEPAMYAKIASTSVEEYETFAKTAIEEMKKQRGEYSSKRIESGKTPDGRPYFVNEYGPGKNYPRYERVAYLQLPKAVAYVVFTAADEAGLRKHQDALKEVVKSFTYMNVKIEK